MGHCTTGQSDLDKEARERAKNKKGYHVRKVREANVLLNATTLTRCENEYTSGKLLVRRAGQTITVFWLGDTVYKRSACSVDIARYNCDWTNELARQANYEIARRNRERMAQQAYRKSTAKIDADFG